MKQGNRYIKLFGWLAAATMLLTTSCKDDLFTGSDTLSDEVTVSFTLTPEAAATVATRGVDYDAAEIHPTISDGSKADVLIYAVYDSEGNLLLNYGNGVDDELEDKFEEGDGQTIMKVKFPVTIRLTLKRGQEYSIAFWAQSSKTKAYNTADLKKVEVIYSEIDMSNSGSSAAMRNATEGEEDTTESTFQTTTPNNDEYRDAFCRSVKFIAGTEGGLEQNVLLYRPLAQINVGTSGFDFEAITRNATKKYTYSKIRLNRVARYLDVVKDKTYSSTTAEDEDKMYSQNEKDKTPESFAVADFGYAPIPAYVNFENEDPKVPNFPSYTIWDEKYYKAYNKTSGDYTGYPEDYSYEYYEPEEFLKVNLYKDMRGENGALKEDIGSEYTKDMDKDGFLDYANMYANDAYRATLNETEKEDLKSETFKYLSMCYVLTSSTKTEKITINNVKVWLATDSLGSDEVEIVNLNHVPVQRNWRTNIIGNLLTEEETFQVTLDRDFAGEYNGWKNENWEWNGPIAKGVYYDAQNDEIQISDADGLVWLQQMVNGKLQLREPTEGGWKIGDLYKYKDLEGEEQTLPDKHIDPTKLSEDVLKRIIEASHIDDNTNLTNRNTTLNNNIKWPDNYNFNFYGATIKLMADIDLAGYEWIPIGFDFAVHDTSAGQSSTTEKFDYTNVTKTEGRRRIFCGTFDGNGHTIYNLENIRFGAEVHEKALQGDTKPYETEVQWMPSGLFGMIGEGAIIKNLNLVNVDLYGYHTAGAIAGIAFSSSKDPILINNCKVDNASIVLSPMYRGDNKSNSDPGVDGAEKGLDRSRTFARGIYAGGIIGHMVAPTKSGIINCSVHNATIRAYRRVGGILGSISNSEQTTSSRGFGGTIASDKTNWDRDNWDLDISGNELSNVLIIADKFQPYHRFYCDKNKDDGDTKVWKTGFGWNSGQSAFGGIFVGGFEAGSTYAEKYNSETSGNLAHGVKFSEFATRVNNSSIERVSTIGNVPLNQLPMLSSWFADKIYLTDNYYGLPSAKTEIDDNKFHPWIVPNSVEKRDVLEGFEFKFPMKLPSSLSVSYSPDAPNAGMYVESVELNGIQSIGKRSLITAENVDKVGNCVMFVTSQDFTQFNDYLTTMDRNVTESEKKKPTTIKNIVLRGAPYAYTGMLISPNASTSEVKLDSVAIYDVYQTIAKVDGANASGADLLLTDCNLRGYTVPGSGWQSITFNHTTFEEGTYVKSIYGASGGDEEQAYTYKAEANATFEHCYFKAPYVIDFGGKTLTFKDNDTPGKDCFATAQSNKNVKITNPIDRPTGVEANAEVSKIRITSDVLGNPIVIYYFGGRIGYGHDGKKFTDKTYNEAGIEIAE